MYSRVLAAIGLAAVTLVFLHGCGGASPVPPADGQVGQDTLSWTNPTEWTDGSPLTAEQLVKVSFQWGNTPAGPFNVGNLDVATTAPGASLTATVERQTVGNRCYIAFAHARETVGGPIVVSQATTPVCKTIKGPPKPPSGLGVS